MATKRVDQPPPDASECRRWCAESSTRWRAGDAAGARQALERAEQAAGSDAHLTVETLAARSVLHVRAEEYDRALDVVLRCLALAETLTELQPEQVLAVLHARVSRGTVLISDAAPPDAASRREDGLAELDEVARDPAADLAVLDRAVNNGLLARLAPLRRRISSGALQVDAWLWVARARELADRHGARGIIVRQAVDLAVHTGQWERGWDQLIGHLDHETNRSEQVALTAKGSQLAWARGDLAAARTLGRRAWDLSVGVELVWSRLYGHLGGVIASAAGAGSLTTAMNSYARCVDRAGHASRPNRAWETALIGMEAGLPATALRAWLDQVLPDGIARPELRALVDIVLSDHGGSAPDPQSWLIIDLDGLAAVDRARALLARGRAALRADRQTAAMVDLHAARLALRDWPGRTRDAVDQTAAPLLDPPAITSAQTRVLDLILEGLSNHEIAAELGCSPRTVAVHVARLLKAVKVKTRTQLAVRELRRRLMVA
ncbi:helix-turn-helix domain-containing protein [Actinoalloteichus hymeniacidonis]|uniref:Transcriptional regulator, luxR family n=1 Tax=Actinoalloteichus hymeniacidonis TaxID=340345 RepID=A0AAC9HS77_9PSEU|nr:helix-turn-helix transcriptional regulator [Actinoalloteichus hymeniacidonis]AOS64011.1 transcriptional regulator, luxR family [Actinoalloteichus hymeniacidonis]MBB5907927.1 DNA-binding CsgD family transcriptional regulator [Actinoalloteichus hymeniacidonis]